MSNIVRIVFAFTLLSSAPLLAPAQADIPDPEFQGILHPSGLGVVQEALRDNGFDVFVSGYLDTRTQEALERFQNRQGLAPTGLPDMETLRRLNVDPEVVYGNLPAPPRAP